MAIMLPYQSDFIRRRNRFEINVKARQVGYSFAFGFKALYRTLIENRDQLIISASLRQSKRVMYFVEQFIYSFRKLPVFTKMKLAIDTQTEKRFSNDKAIICLPASPETLRSLSGDLFLDEFSHYKEDYSVFQAAIPSITRGFDVTISSTPLGKSNMFYDIWNEQERYKDYKRYMITIHDAIRQGLKIDFNDIKNNFDEESIRQEYECEFIDEQTSYFPFTLLKSCFEDYENIKGRSCMGVDVGRTNDRTCIAVATEYKDKYYLTHLESLHNKEFDEQHRTIKAVFLNNGIDKGLIDKGAIGYQLAEELGKELINFKGVFTNQINFMTDVVTFAKKLMEQGKVKIDDDRDLINDYHRIKRVILPSNKITFRIDRNKSGHGDRAIAHMLSLYNFKQGRLPDIC